jgi:hypothetical protein
MPSGKKLNYRSFVSLLTTFSFSTAAVSGLVLYVSPQGRVAFWQNWTMLGLGKAEWNSLHTLGSLLFAVTSLFHLWFNWKPMVGYLKSRMGSSFEQRRELAAASLVALFVVASAIYGLPPLNGVVSFGDRVKDSWAKGGDSEPPFPHAELLTLKGLTTRQGIDTGTAMNCLERQAIRVRNDQETLQSIARNNGVAPSDVYSRIKSLPVKSVTVTSPAIPTVAATPSAGNRLAATIRPRLAHAASVAPVTPASVSAVPPEIERYNEDSVVIKFEGTGVGKKSLEQVCREFDIPLATAQRKLAAKGLTVSPGETFKDAAKRAGLVPIQILQAVLVGEPARK